jgi:trehalose 6-phosphate phosphatase
MQWAYFFDIDGTLIEIAASPDQIFVDRQLAALIERLHAVTGGAVALITGRSIRDVDQVFPVTGMAVAGQHGLELRDAWGHLITHALRTESLNEVRQQLIEAIARHSGLVAELKGLSIALHYRAAPRLAGYAHRLMRSLQARFVPDFVLQRGKRVVELKPAGRDKGVAISELMQEPPFVGRVPVFVGDDATDEFGFSVVNDMNGYSIKVGGGPTIARYRLKDVSAVKDWLAQGLEAAPSELIGSSVAKG